jgi:hypothetical protein
MMENQLRKSFVMALVCLPVWIWTGAFVSFSSGAPAWALTLITPEQGATATAGGAIPVAVSLVKELNLRTIHYYWYRIDEEPLASRQAQPAPFRPRQDGSLFVGTVAVPKDALGTMRLLAVGEVVGGRLESHEEFDEVLVSVDTTAELQTIEFSVEKPWRLTQVGKRVVVPAVGQFSDSVLRPLTGPGTGSRFFSSNDRVISVDAAGVVQTTGRGKADVAVENRGKTGTVEVIVEADEEPNRPPIAEVVKELHVKSGDLVLLDGLRSRDPDGDPLHFEWKQIMGHRVILSNVNEAKATFVAPKVSEQKQYQFSLIVTDMAGPDTIKGADSPPAVVNVWITP